MRVRLTHTTAVVLLVGLPSLQQNTTSATAKPEVTAPPKALVERLGLTSFYKKCLLAGGFPILGSDKVSDYAFYEARYLIDHMLRGRDDIRAMLVKRKIRFVVMAASEMTSQVPEHSDLKPNKFWDRRARGLGATNRRPATSCGEENLLDFPGDPYHAENILIHEFAHTIHQQALIHIDPTFDRRLRKAYRAATGAGLWKGKYAATNPAEYWAEGVQSWFDTNRPPDHDHNYVDTREELREYDPKLAALCEEVFGNPAWRYKKPRDRKSPGHLEGFDRKHAPRFAWPKGLNKWYREYTAKQRAKSKK